jgi:hypothetical protein
MDNKTRLQLINDFIPINFSYKHTHSKNGRNNYTVLLKTDKGKASFKYFQGFGIKDNPNLLSVLYCLISDVNVANEYENDLVGFSSEFGYNDTIEAKTVLKACIKQRDKLNRLGIVDYLEELTEVFQDY